MREEDGNQFDRAEVEGIPETFVRSPYTLESIELFSSAHGRFVL